MFQMTLEGCHRQAMGIALELWKGSGMTRWQAVEIAFDTVEKLHRVDLSVCKQEEMDHALQHDLMYPED